MQDCDGTSSKRANKIFHLKDDVLTSHGFSRRLPGKTADVIRGHHRNHITYICVVFKLFDHGLSLAYLLAQYDRFQPKLRNKPGYSITTLVIATMHDKYFIAYRF
jgi:hypothetical protein